MHDPLGQGRMHEVEPAIRVFVEQYPTSAWRPALAVAAEAPVAAGSRAVFRREGQSWTVVYGDVSSHLKDGKGPRYLAQLLANPGQRIAAIDLVGTDAVRADGSAGPALDAQTKAAYQQRLRDIKTERDEAEAFNDPGRLEALDAEMAALVRELDRAIGLGGRDRMRVTIVPRDVTPSR